MLQFRAPNVSLRSSPSGRRSKRIDLRAATDQVKLCLRILCAQAKPLNKPAVLEELSYYLCRFKYHDFENVVLQNLKLSACGGLILYDSLAPSHIITKVWYMR